jgi:membrane protein implicated in regulation of membrane protease activity
VDGWVLWVIAACALAVGEMATMGFFLAPFAGGAVLAAIAAAAGAGTLLSWALFVVGSLLLLGVVRPLARAHLRTPPLLRTGTDALVGRTGIVVERIADDGSAGSVRIDGDDVWTARAYDEDARIEPGTRVHVLEIRGATALVAE